MKNLSALDRAEKILTDALHAIHLAQRISNAVVPPVEINAPKRRKLSAAARRRIGAAQRKRWALIRGGKKAA